MATQMNADAALEKHHQKLFEDFSSLRKLSVCRMPDGEFCLEAALLGNIPRGFPVSIQAPSGEVVCITSVIAETRSNTWMPNLDRRLRRMADWSKYLKPQLWPEHFLVRAPVIKGGHSVESRNPRRFGTVGCVVKLQDDNDAYIISSAHVLGDQVGGEIYHPPSSALSIGTAAREKIGELYWALNDKEFDVAVAKIDSPRRVNGGVLRVGSFDSKPGKPELGSKALKTGCVTEDTQGTIISTNAAVRMPDGSLKRNQIEAIIDSTWGDSGAILFQIGTNRIIPVGLVMSILFVGGKVRTYSNNLQVLFSKEHRLSNGSNGSFKFDSLVNA